MSNLLLNEGHSIEQNESPSVAPNKWMKRAKCICILVFLVVALVVAAIVAWEARPPRYLDDFQQIWSVSDGMAIVVPWDGAIAVIDIESGRALRFFRSSENRMYSSARFTSEPDTIIVEQGRRRIWEQRATPQVDLIDINSGRTLFSHRGLRWANGGIVTVLGTFTDEEGNVLNTSAALFDIESGEELIPFGEHEAVFTFDGRIHMHLSSGGTDIFRITDEREIVFVGRYSGVSSLRPYEGVAMVSYQGNRYFLDVESGEKTRAPGNHRDVFHNFGGFVTYQRGEEPNTESALVELATGRELIPYGQYERIVLLSNHKALIAPVRHGEWGVIDFVSGEMLIPVGTYDAQWPSFQSQRPIEMLLVYSNGEPRLIEIVSGNEIIVFGKYDDISIFDGNVVAVLQDGRWRFYKTEEIA